jgi:4-amino-4-deoxy-L-arabinose transferase-like glycosyltransferase
MKTFKTIDFWISVVLIVFFAIISIFKIRSVLEFNIAGLGSHEWNLMTGYFVVGGWQVCSMLVHAFAGWFATWGSARKRYSILVLILIVLLPLGLWFNIEATIIPLYLLLFLAPVMALYYTYLCYSELRKMKSRPMDLLK